MEKRRMKDAPERKKIANILTQGGAHLALSCQVASRLVVPGVLAHGRTP